MTFVDEFRNCFESFYTRDSHARFIDEPSMCNLFVKISNVFALIFIAARWTTFQLFTRLFMQLTVDEFA